MTTNTHEMRTERRKLHAELEAMHDRAKKEQRNFTPDETKRFEDGMARLGVMKSTLDRAEQIEHVGALLNASQGVTTRGGGAGGDPVFLQQIRERYHVTRAFRSQIPGEQVDAGFELEVHAELARQAVNQPRGILVPHEVFMQKRALTTGGSGGNLVPTTHRPDLYIDRLRSRLQVVALGATVLDGLMGDVDIPRLTASATAQWVAEHSAVTATDPTFDQVTLQPKTVGAMAEMSRRMLINASPAVEQLVRDDLAKQLATAIDKAAIDGDGSGNKPVGIRHTSSVGSVSFAGPPTWAKVLEMIATIAIADADMGTLGWLGEPYFVKKARSTVRVASTDSRFVMESWDELAGYPFRQTTQIPATVTGSPLDPSALYFGDWSALLIGYWSAVDILVNPYHTDVFAKGGVLINAFQDVDVKVRHPESFVVATDIEVA